MYLNDDDNDDEGDGSDVGDDDNGVGDNDDHRSINHGDNHFNDDSENNDDVLMMIDDDKITTNTSSRSVHDNKIWYDDGAISITSTYLIQNNMIDKLRSMPQVEEMDIWNQTSSCHIYFLSLVHIILLY